jgi:uncharacterized protein HemY
MDMEIHRHDGSQPLDPDELATLGVKCIRNGMHADAESLLKRALESYEQKQSCLARAISALVNLVDMLQAQNRHDDASMYLDRYSLLVSRAAVELRDDMLGDNLKHTKREFS